MKRLDYVYVVTINGDNEVYGAHAEKGTAYKQAMDICMVDVNLLLPKHPYLQEVVGLQERGRFEEAFDAWAFKHLNALWDEHGDRLSDVEVQTLEVEYPKRSPVEQLAHEIEEG